MVTCSVSFSRRPPILGLTNMEEMQTIDRESFKKSIAELGKFFGNTITYFGVFREKIPADSGFIIGIKLNSADCPQSGSLEDVTFIGKKLDVSSLSYFSFQ